MKEETLTKDGWKEIWPYMIHAIIIIFSSWFVVLLLNIAYLETFPHLEPLFHATAGALIMLMMCVLLHAMYKADF